MTLASDIRTRITAATRTAIPRAHGDEHDQGLDRDERERRVQRRADDDGARERLMTGGDSHERPKHIESEDNAEGNRETARERHGIPFAR